MKRAIYLAGGCFWGVAEYFSRVPGVTSTIAGYANGTTAFPTYEEVCSHATGHAETVRVRYDDDLVSLTTLLLQFFRIIDPTSAGRQGNDIGPQYRPGCYYEGDACPSEARAVFDATRLRVGPRFAVELLPLTCFYEAEPAHQDYLKRVPWGYCHVDFSTLRDLPADMVAGHPRADDAPAPDARWTRPGDGELARRLTLTEYAVTRESATEPPFTGRYWDSHEKGLYVDVVTGEPLFLSSDKFDAGCGWPSFTRPVTPGAVATRTDTSFGMTRVEVRSRHGDSHLGHVFADGPRERGGLRYCINGAALRFVKASDMAAEGYGEWLSRLD